MIFLNIPEQKTVDAAMRVGRDRDGMEFLAFLEYSVHELDQANRLEKDPVLMRQRQGAAQAIAEILELAAGRTQAITRRTANTHQG